MSRRKKKSKLGQFWKTIRFLKPYKVLVIVSILCAFMAAGALTGGLAAALPVMKILIEGKNVQEWIAAGVASARADNPVPTFLIDAAEWIGGVIPTDPVWAVAVIIGVVLALTMLGNVFRFFHEFFIEKTAVGATNDLRKELYGRTLRLPLGYFGRIGTSDVTSRLTVDAMSVQQGFQVLLGRGVQEPLNALWAFAFALIIDWRLTLFIVLFAPIMAVLLRKLGKKVRRAARAALTENAEMLGQIEASLDGIKVVKSTAAENYEGRRYGRIMDRLEHQQVRTALYEAFVTPMMETFAVLAVGLVAVVAAYFVTKQQSLTPSEFILILACLGAVGEAMRKLSKLNTSLQKANAGAGRVMELVNLETETETSDAGTTPWSPETFKRIAFEGVTYRYPGAEEPAVREVSIDVERGQSVAIVGRNGSGKTTLLGLLPRFFHPEAGRVTIDGTDVRELDLEHLRTAIGIVTQEGALFPGTIAENIAYGIDDAPADAVRAAAKRAYADEFIRQ
ncbi:MAG: ABC transporter ATP-binding protein, partial [Planctomycetota bacterium]